MRTRSAVLAGSVVSGMLSSACCLCPLVLALLGISGVAFAPRLEPLRPYLLVVTYGLLGGAFYLTYRPAREECGPGERCGMSRTSGVGKVALWVAVVVVVLATAFPWYSAYLF